MVKADLAKRRHPRGRSTTPRSTTASAGPGPAFPDRDLEGASAAIAVSRTYLDSARSGIARAYWYSWAPKNDLLGMTMYPGTVGAATYSRIYSWLASRLPRLRDVRPLDVLHLRQEPQGLHPRWTERGIRVVVVPPGHGPPARRSVAACGQPGARFVVTPMPVRFA